MKFLYLIPARGGSKGIPGKNTKLLAGKPLLHYSIELARELTEDEHICVSTDDKDIVDCAKEISLKVPFMRPDELATDTAGTYGVLLHAIEHFEKQGCSYDAVVLLQPTSPLRTVDHLADMLKMYTSEMDMLVSVVQPEHNPVCVSFVEDKDKSLKRLFSEESTLRQEVPEVYNYNGAIYIMNISSLKKGSYNDFKKIYKYEMDAQSSLDLDTPFDWEFMEFVLNRR
ncbi:MAG: acylneuraminate cytidylyltransferase family protein [Lentisphaeraceae bacterium]|nr:acylneuraminate cytidylyltransferase family protein [Lentisphaeraceae bacterium]